MKTKLLFLFCVAFSCYIAAQSADLDWAKRIGGDTNATRGVYGSAVTADEQGNSYTAGVFLSGTYKLDGITLTIPARTRSGGYIAKYKPNGQIAWAKPLGNIQVLTILREVNTTKLLVDKEGNIYFCGRNSMNAASVIGNYYITDGDANAIGDFKTHFLAKLDSNGSVLWVKTTNHPNYSYWKGYASVTNELFFDQEGNVNMTGGFQDYITFDDNHTLTTATGEAGVYLTKYTPQGEVLSAKLLEGVYPEDQYYTEQVKADASGKLYRWSTRMNKNQHPVLYRYTAQGELVGTKIIHMTTTSNSPYKTVYSEGFTVTPSGGVLVGGSWLGKTLTIEGQTYGGDNTNSDDQAESDSDAFVLKLKSPDYNIDWVYLESTSEGENFEYLISDGLGNIYAAGKWRSNFTPEKLRIRKLNSVGESLWQKIINYKITANATKVGQRDLSALAQTRNGGNIWVSGYYQENVYFGEAYHFTTPIATGTNFYNGFLAKYGTCNTANPVIETPASTEFCEGGDLTLSANISNPALSYFWSTPNGNIPAVIAGATATLSITKPGKYSLIAQENAECYGKSQEIWLTQIPKPDSGITQDNNTLTASAAGEGIAYQWLDCDNGNYPIEGATSRSYTPPTSGSYAVQVTNAKGCGSISECKQVQWLDVKELSPKAIALYPNPAKSKLFLQTADKVRRIDIINMLGQTVLTFRNTKEVDVSMLPNGLYLVSAKTENGIWKGKFLKHNTLPEANFRFH